MERPSPAAVLAALAKIDTPAEARAVAAEIFQVSDHDAVWGGMGTETAKVLAGLVRDGLVVKDYGKRACIYTLA